MIFKEPMTSLNPVFTVGNQNAEAIILHEKVTKEEARRRTIELLGKVHILEAKAQGFSRKQTGAPHQGDEDAVSRAHMRAVVELNGTGLEYRFDFIP